MGRPPLDSKLQLGSGSFDYQRGWLLPRVVPPPTIGLSLGVSSKTRQVTNLRRVDEDVASISGKKEVERSTASS